VCALPRCIVCRSSSIWFNCWRWSFCCSSTEVTPP
jgi:hypothetical protein